MTAAITLHFRKPDFTCRCVDSLLLDGWSPVLVWDNSEDSGASLQLLQQYYVDDPRVWLVSSPANLGFGRGMNAALAELARQGYSGPVLLVNNDVQVWSGMREALYAQLPPDGSNALVAPRLMQAGQEQGWLFYQPWLALVTHHPLPGSFAYLSGCCMLVQRPDNALPLFDEDFFMYGEDVELSWRMRRQGALLLLLEKGYLAHEGSGSTGLASEAYERFLVHSHWLLAEKLAPFVVSRMLMRMLRLLSLPARACLRSWRYKTLIPLRALSVLIKADMPLASWSQRRKHKLQDP